MNRRTLITLVIIIAALSAILMTNRQDFDGGETSVLLPGLDQELNDITSLTIRTAGNRVAVTLSRGAEQWVVAQRDAYPADIGKIRDNLISLANATIVEEKTADPALYTRLGVEDIAKEDAGGIELVIEGPGEPYRMIIGTTGVRGDHAYARKPGAAVSLLIAASLDLGTEPADWLDHTIIDIAASDIFSATTTHPDGERVRIEKTGPDASSFELIDQPANRELTYPGVTASIGSVLTDLVMDDVVARTGVSLENVQPIVTRFETFDGLIVITKTYTSDKMDFVGFEFTTDTELEARFTANNQEDLTGDTAATRADNLNIRLGGWLFILPGHKQDELTHHMSDLLSEPENQS